MWMAVRGKVYNITPYLHFHPGGVDELMRAAGADGTQLFNEVHQWVNYESMLQKCLVGFLVPDEDTEPLHEDDEPNGAPRQTAPASVSASSGSSGGFLTPSGTAQKQKKTGLGVRVDWHQTPTDVVATIYLRGVKEGEVSFGNDDKSFKITVISEAVAKVLPGKTFFAATYSLEKEIRTNECKVVVGPAKIEVVLKKAEEGVRWELKGDVTSELASHLDSITTNVSGVYFPCTILEIRPHSHNVKIFRFGYQSEVKLRFPIGHHITLKAVDNDRPIFRNFTPISPLDLDPPLAETPEEGERGPSFELLIKLYEEGQMSQYLSRLAVGDRSLSFSASTGNFDFQSMVRLSGGVPNIGLIAAGTGLTPMVGVVEQLLRSPVQGGQIRLLFSNREERDILYREEIEDWEKRATVTTFKARHTLSQPPSGWTGLSGRITKDMIDENLPKAREGGFILVCGPPAFTSLMMKYLTQLDFPEKLLHAFT